MVIHRLFYVAILASLVTSAAAQEASDESLIASAKAKVAGSLARPVADISFDDIRVVRDDSGVGICGTANGRRFVSGTGEKAAATMEGSLSVTVFNYLWNLRCKGMKTSEAGVAFGKDLREDVCTVESWNWTRWGNRSIQLQGLASCQSGRILIKVFDGDTYLGSGSGRIEAQAFTVYVARVPTGNALRIEYATGK